MKAPLKFICMLGAALLVCQKVPVLGAEASPLPPNVTLAYGRDAAEFLKRHHAGSLRDKATSTSRKFALMSDSAIGFFRGSAPLFYRDINEHAFLNSSVKIPLVGDLHLENASAFKTAKGVGTFELDDFDEAIEGPYTYDLVRLLVSTRLIAQEVNFSRAVSDRLVQRFLNTYLSRLTSLAGSPDTLKLPVAASWVPGPAAQAVQQVNARKASAEQKRWFKAGKLRTRKKVRPVDTQTRRAIVLSLSAYAATRREPPRFFRVKDVARRIAGLASLSKQRYVVLIEGPSPSNQDDVLLELKQQGQAAAVPFLPGPRGNQAERVRKAWDYFVPESDKFLGTAPGGGADFLVRSLSLLRQGVEAESLTSEWRFTQYLDAFALITARAHARSGRGREILADAVNSRALTQRLSNFSEAYARQVESDREIWKTYIDP